MWPLLAAYLTRRHGAMGDVLVITPHANVADWARTGWHQDGPLGSTLAFAPTVLQVGEPEAWSLLRAPSPEMAFFAAWAVQSRHGPDAMAIALAALRRAGELTDPALQSALARSILGVLSDALKEAILAMISPERMPALEPWLEQLIQQWEARGEARGEATALRRILACRGIAVDPSTQTRITACTDTATLESWIDRAVTATTLRDVFTED